jgi:PKD repeat protein
MFSRLHQLPCRWFGLRARKQRRTVSFRPELICLEERLVPTSQAYSTTDAVGNQGFTGNLGLDFNVNSPIQVDSLGAFDSGQDGFVGTITVGLYTRLPGGDPNNDHNGTLIQSVTLTGTDGTLAGNYRFVQLGTPLVLQAGFYTIDAVGFSNSDLNGNEGLPGSTVTTDDGGGLISFVGSGRFDAITVPDYPSFTGAQQGFNISPPAFAAGSFLFCAATQPDAPLSAGALTPPSVAEGQAFSNVPVFHFTDGDPAGAAKDFTAVVTLGDGNSVTLTSTPGPNGQIVAKDGGFDVQLTYTYTEELCHQTFSVQVADVGGATTCASTDTFHVADAVPVAGPITGPTSVFPGQSLTLSAPFTDTGTLDTHTGTFDWGDGTTSTVYASEVNGSGTVSSCHAYTDPGVYTVNLTVADANSTTSAPVSFTVTVNDPVDLLSSTARGALTLTENGTLNLKGALDVNSRSSQALLASGNSSVTAASIDVVGGVQATGNATFNPTPHTGAAAMSDPFGPTAPGGGLSAPNLTGTADSVKLSGHSSRTISPGIYRQIKVAVNAHLTLLPGVYVIAGGGFAVTGNGSVTGSGVFLYNAGSNYPNTGGDFGRIVLGRNASLNLSSPTAGHPYAGILFFQSRDNHRTLFLNGTALQGTQGTIYAPAAMTVLIGDSPLENTLVVNTLTVIGNVTKNLTPGGAVDLIDTLGMVLASDLGVSVDNPTWLFTSAAAAQIQDVITSLAAVLPPFNVPPSSAVGGRPAASPLPGSGSELPTPGAVDAVFGNGALLSGLHGGFLG